MEISDRLFSICVNIDRADHCAFRLWTEDPFEAVISKSPVADPVTRSLRSMPYNAQHASPHEIKAESHRRYSHVRTQQVSRVFVGRIPGVTFALDFIFVLGYGASGRRTTMEVRQASFMLLPSFSFRPDHTICLGTILTSAKGSKLPDPKRPLNGGTRMEVDPSAVQHQHYEPWIWSNCEGYTVQAGLYANVPFLTGVGGNVSKAATQGNSLAIASKHVYTSSFRPDAKYLARAVQDETVKAIRQKLFSPPLYMVVGLMVADGAEISIIQERSNGHSAGLGLDVTQMGAPLNIGSEAGYNRSSNTKLTGVPTEPFILAYEIVRLRAKKDGSVQEWDENKWAIFDDSKDTAASAFEDSWEIEMVSPADLLSCG